MNKLLVVAVLVGLVALSAEGFRLRRQSEEEPGTLSQIADTVKSYYNSAVSTAGGYVESLRNLKLDEKAKQLYSDTTTALSTYTGIAHDQIYHILYPQH